MKRRICITPVPFSLFQEKTPALGRTKKTGNELIRYQNSASIIFDIASISRYGVHGVA